MTARFITLKWGLSRKSFLGRFGGGKVPHKFLIKFAAVFALLASLDPVLARISFIHSQEIFAGGLTAGVYCSSYGPLTGPLANVSTGQIRF
jgi:hypothetical protein